MTTPVDGDEGSPGPPTPPREPADGSSATPDPPNLRVTERPQATLARLLDRRGGQDGARAEALLRALLDASPIAMWVLDTNGHVVLWNGAAERLTGWTAEETLGRPVPIIPPDKVDEFRHLFGQALGKEPVLSAEVRRLRKDGSLIDLSLSSAALVAPDGTVVAVLVMAADLTARKQAEEAERKLAAERAAREAADAARQQLQESEERFRSLVEASAQMVWRTDAEGRIVSSVPDWTDITGQSSSEAQGFGMLGTVHEEDRPEVERLWRDAIASKRPFSATFRLRIANGTYRWFAARGVPVLESDGKVREWVGTSSDIHERKSAEAALRESEALFRNMADSVPVMLWMTEPDGSCSFLNQKWYEFTGQTPATGLGTGWIGALHPDDHAGAREAFLAANARREPYKAEFRMRRADGEYRWAIGSAMPRFGPNNEFRGYVGSSVDITERRQMEDALRDSERRHRRIFDTVEVSIWDEDFSGVKAAIDKLKHDGVTDIRRHLTDHPEFATHIASLMRVNDVNDATLTMFGARSKAELQQSLDRVFTAATLATINEEIIAIFEGQARFQSEASCQTLHGKPMQVALTIAFPPDDPQLRSVLVSLIDITDRKRVEAEREKLLGAERAARQRTDQLQTVTAALVEAVTVEDVADRVVETVRETTTAKSATLALLSADGTEFEVIRMMGLPEAVAAKWQRFPVDPGLPSTQAVRTGEPIFLRSPEEIREQFPKIGASAAEVGFEAAAVLPLVVAGVRVGTLGLNYAKPQPFDPGKRAYLAAVAQQCAQALERARLFEAERAARAEAERARQDADTARTTAEDASRAKSDFLATMSHELRTPLNAIIGYQSLLADGVTGPVSDSQRRQLERIGTSAHHLLSLIDEVLTLSRVEAGKESLHLEPVDVAVILDEASSIIEPLAKQKKLEFVVVGPAGPITIETDGGKLRQALLNLLSNAVKFTGRGSVTLRAAADGDEVLFEVRDTGIGIAAQHLERVFEPFWQVEASMTRTAAGTGLGLAVTRRLVSLLGGTVTVQSAVGEGSTFSIRLPRTAPPRE